MVKKLIDYLLPKNINTNTKVDMYEHKNRRLFIYIMLITAIAVLPFIITNITLNKNVYAVIDIVAFFCLTINIFFYKRYGNYRVSFSFQIIFSTILLACIHAVSHHLVSINLIWVPLLILTSFYMSGKKLGTQLSIIILAIMLAAEILPQYYNIPQEFMTTKDINLFTIMHLTISAFSAIALSSRLTSEEYKLFQTINNKNKVIEKAHEFNSTLLNTLSHDLSNPLTTIDHLLAMIFKKEEEQSRNTIIKLNKLNFQVNRMFEIVRQAKTFKSLDSGKKNIKIEKVSLESAINTTIYSIEELAKVKNIKINKKYYNKTYQVKAELVSLSNNVLNNILSNAIKFSHKDSTIDICIKPVKEKLQLTVIDHGTGMPENILKKIFSPSAQTSRVGTNGELGTGFGMPIVKMFLDQYGAEIKLESNELNKDSYKEPGTKVIIDFLKAA